MYYLIICLLILTGCSNDGSDKVDKEDPIYGNWGYIVPGTNNQKGIITIIGKDGTFTNMSFYGYSDGINKVKIYFRRYSGTYVRTGDRFDIKYDYESCDPIETDTLNIKNVTDDRIYLSVPRLGLFLTYNRAPTANAALDITAIEDKNCTILSKLEKKEKRSIASMKKTKSFFNRILK